MIVVRNDGAVVAVNTNTLVAMTIAPVGTITTPSRLSCAVNQWGAQYIQVISKQTNGYFLWDGTTFYTPGGAGPAVTVTNGGSGYTSAPSVSFSGGGGGSGAAATATVLNGVVVSIQITNPGSGYTSAPTIAFSGGGGVNAAATTTFMQTGISGTAIENYAGRVWIANGPTITFSAPGSVQDFSSANGGGNFTSADSFLRIGYIQLKQTNGFLYLIADSSVNYISSVQTSGTPPVTTFTNQNADPESGTPWPATVDVFNRNVLFANPFGAQVSYGGAVSKISEDLDGIYNTVSNFGNISPSAAKAILFGKKIWMLLLPVIDPVSNQQTNKLFCWNQKIWWAAHQEVPLVFVNFQEINSNLTAFGTDGSSIYQLFAQPSTSLQKVAQTRLWDNPGGYQFTKFINRFLAMVQYYNTSSPTINIALDNESGSTSLQAQLTPATSTWLTALNAVSTWLTAGAAVSTWLSGGANQFSISEPDSVGTNGVLNGFTVTTNSADVAIISMMIQPDMAGYRG
jgi:hypothetical protein